VKRDVSNVTSKICIYTYTYTNAYIQIVTSMRKLYILERRILQCIVHNRERKRERAIAKVRELPLGKMGIASIHEYSRLT